MSYKDDIKLAKKLLADLPTKWDGKTRAELQEILFLLINGGLEAALRGNV